MTCILGSISMLYRPLLNTFCDHTYSKHVYSVLWIVCDLLQLAIPFHHPPSSQLTCLYTNCIVQKFDE